VEKTQRKKTLRGKDGGHLFAVRKNPGKPRIRGRAGTEDYFANGEKRGETRDKGKSLEQRISGSGDHLLFRLKIEVGNRKPSLSYEERSAWGGTVRKKKKEKETPMTRAARSRGVEVGDSFNVKVSGPITLMVYS